MGELSSYIEESNRRFAQIEEDLRQIKVMLRQVRDAVDAIRGRST